MATDIGSLQLPLSTRLLIDGEEGPATGGEEFYRENPADNRQVVTAAAKGSAEDARAAIDAARRAFDSNTENWIYNYKLREQVLYRTAQLIREHAPRLAEVVSLEVGMPIRQAIPTWPPPPTFLSFTPVWRVSFTVNASPCPPGP